MKKFITIFLIGFLTILLNAKVPRVFVSVKQKDIKAGDKVEIMIGGEAKKGSKFKFPNIKEIGGYKVLSKKASVSYRVDEANGKKKPLVKRSITYTIKPTKTFDIKSFTFKINKKEFKTVPFRVKIADSKKPSKKEEKKPKKEIIDKKKEPKKSKETTKTKKAKDKKEVQPKKEAQPKKPIQKIEAKKKIAEKKPILKQPQAKDTIANKKDINPQKSNNNIDFIFKMSTNKKEVVVGESFIVKVELIEPINLSSSDLQYTPPEFQNFRAKPIGEGEIEENTDKVIRTIEYIVTPKKSGTFTINPAKAKIGIQLTPQVQSPFGFFGTDIEWKKISTNRLKIRVKPAPKGVDLIGKFKLETFTDTKRARANKPYNYTIRVIGIGNLDNFKLPDINIDNITTYKEDPQIEHIVKKGIIISKLTQKYVFISDRDFAIPSIRLKVYNPDSKKVYTLKTKPLIVKINRTNSITSILNNKNKTTPHSIKSAELSKIKQSSIQIKQNSNIESKDIKKVEKLLVDKYYYKRKYSSGYPLSTIFGALALGLILGAGAVILIPGLFRVSKNGKLSYKNRLFDDYEDALNILYPHITKSKDIEKMVANLYEVTNGNKDVKIDDYALNKMIKRVKES